MLSGTPLEDCFAFWLSRRSGRSVPLKSAIDPVEMPRHIIPHLFIYERTPDGRLRCRLGGTAVCTAFQYDPTGRYLDEMVPPEAHDSRIPLFQNVIDRALPLAFSGNMVVPGRTWIKFRRLMMPISIRGDAADGIFGMVIFPGFALRRSGPRLVDDGMRATEAWATAADLTQR